MPETRSAHPYFLYDAIVAQPKLVEQVFSKSRAAIERAVQAAAGRKRIVFIGIGTSLNAANVAERWMRHHSGGRALARAEQSFEFAHYPLALGADDAAVIITHTGTTSQSVEALRAARAMGALTIAVTGQNPGEGVLERGRAHRDLRAGSGLRVHEKLHDRSRCSRVAGSRRARKARLAQRWSERPHRTRKSAGADARSPQDRG